MINNGSLGSSYISLMGTIHSLNSICYVSYGLVLYMCLENSIEFNGVYSPFCLGFCIGFIKLKADIDGSIDFNPQSNTQEGRDHGRRTRVAIALELYFF